MGEGGKSSPLSGIVTAVQANYYRVQLSALGGESEDAQVCEGGKFPSQELLCTRRSRLKKIGQQVMVGDRVWVEEADWLGGRGAIAAVVPRVSELDRPPVANVDQLLLVFALAEPTLDPWQLSRFLVKGEETGLSLCLCLSKADLVGRTVQLQWEDRLKGWGYEPLCISLTQDWGISALEDRLRDRTTVIAGPSGVGKSSLVNTLIPGTNLRTGSVSGKLGRGRHTTRHVELFQLPCGGFMADTPGFNQPTLDGTPEDLAHCFPEVQQRLATTTCQFSDCLHRNEPGCVVRGLWERYEYYLTFLDEAIALHQNRERSGDSESVLKVKSRGEGRLEYEPKLPAKRYRRPSRRTQRQSLQNLCEDPER